MPSRNRNQRRTSEPRRRFIIAILKPVTRKADGKRNIGADGQVIKTYVEVEGLESVHAHVRNAGGDSDKIGNDQMTTFETLVFNIPYRDNISTGYAARYQGKLLGITRIVPIEHPTEGRFESIDIYCGGTAK